MKINDILFEFAPESGGKDLDEGAEFGSKYAEQLAQQVFNHNSNIEDENEVLNLGYNIAKSELGSRAQGMFRDEDFPSDFVSAYFYLQKQGVAEGLNDTIYPNAEVIKSKNGKPVGEIYQDGNEWGCFHYKADRGYDMIDSREDAIEALKDLHQETSRSRPDYTIKGVAEGMPASVIKSKQRYAEMTPTEFAKAHGNKSDEELQAMAWRHGYGKGSNHYVDKRDKGRQGVAEMDKSQPSHGRDGHVSHSTYGSRDKKGSDYFTGKEAPGKPVNKKQMSKDALDILKNQGVAEGYDTEELANEVYAEFERMYPNLARRADERTVHAAIMDVLNYGGDNNAGALAQDVARAVKQQMQQGVAEVSDETLTSYLTKVDADSQKHEKDPTKRSPEKRNRSVQGFARAFNKLDARKEKVDEISKKTLGDYLHAAHRDIVDKASSSSFQSGQAGDRYNRADATAKDQKREQGMARAVSRLTKEGLADEFMKMAQAKGYNARLQGTPDEERERTQQMLAQRAQERGEEEKRVGQEDLKIIDQLKDEYQQLLARYQSLGGSNWHYADREQNLSSSEREARSMEPSLNQLRSRIARAEKHKDQPQEQAGLGFGEGHNEKIGGRYEPDDFDVMVKRLGQRAREQEQTRPVDVQDLARKLRAIEQSKDDK